jgi:hypothetical protein
MSFIQIIFTAVDVDDVRNQCLGQAHVKLGSPGDIWKTGGHFMLPFQAVQVSFRDIELDSTFSMTLSVYMIRSSR